VRALPRQDASLFDVSHMGSLRITGKDRVAFLESVTVGDVQALAEDQARLSSIVNDKFGIIDGAAAARAAWGVLFRWRVLFVPMSVLCDCVQFIPNYATFHHLKIQRVLFFLMTWRCRPPARAARPPTDRLHDHAARGPHLHGDQRRLL
jgi:folate-binding Fe-S cluster repair protein YgfZ